MCQGGSSGYLVNSGILTTLIDETKSPTLHPTFYPSVLPTPEPTRTYAPTVYGTDIVPYLIMSLFFFSPHFYDRTRQHQYGHRLSAGPFFGSSGVASIS